MRKLNVSDYFLVRFSDIFKWHLGKKAWYILKNLIKYLI